MGKIITCCAQKGGCAKTVTTHNLAYAFSQKGFKVLLVDMDAQANLTKCLGVEETDSIPTIADLLEHEIKDDEVPFDGDAILHFDNLDLIPADSRLSAVSESLILELGSERYLANILSSIRDRYDFILVDTGPKLDNLSINAMVAADYAIIPVSPQFLSVVGLENQLKAIFKVKRRLNHTLQLAGIVMTMCQPNTNLTKIVIDQIKEEYKERCPIFGTQIPVTIRVGEAVYKAQSVIEYAPSSSAAIAYQQLADEFLSR